ADDSVRLTRVRRDLESVPGVTRAAAMMATAQNRALMQDAGLLTIVGQLAGATDLVIAVFAADETIARRAESAVRAALAGHATATAGAGATPRPPTTPSPLPPAPGP